MANNIPDDKNESGDPHSKDSKSPSDIPAWLRTDDWLQITPPPIKRDLPDIPDIKTPNVEDQATDMIEIDEEEKHDDLEVPPSTMLFSDPDDSVILTDDISSSGPLSAILRSSDSSLRLPKTPPPAQSTTRESSSDSHTDDDNEVDLGGVPQLEHPHFAGPSTSGIRHRGLPAADASGSDDVLSTPFKPTQPASGWLLDSSKSPEIQAPPAEGSSVDLPSIPTISQSKSTWSELEVPATKMQQPPETASKEHHPDSWHPSSGNIGVPSMANIDLPPDEAEGSDIFSKAARPGVAPSALKIEIPKPRPVVKSEEIKPPTTTATPASPSIQLPSIPELPEQQPKGSWHPSSGNVHLPSMGEIDLPPSGDSDVFSEANRPGKQAETLSSTPPATIAPPPQIPDQPNLDPLTATLFDVSGSKTFSQPDSDIKSLPSFEAVPLEPQSEPLGLEPTSDFNSSADIDLPPEPTEDASDIFSTATKPKTRTPDGSGLFSCAPSLGAPITSTPSQLSRDDSHLLIEPEKKTPPNDTAGKIDLNPQAQNPSGTAQPSPSTSGSETGQINFSLPGKTTDASRTSNIEVVDSSGTLSEREDDQDDVLSADERIEKELADQLDDEEGKPDFNFLGSSSPSDSNILGDRALAELSSSGPHSSSVNLGGPDSSIANSVDSAQVSNIFNKLEQGEQESGHVDLDEIPILGSSDSSEIDVETGNSTVLGGHLDKPGGPDLEESVFDVSMPKDESADSGMIDWSADAAKITDRLGLQSSMEASIRAEQSSGSDQSSLATVARTTSRPSSRPDIDDFDQIERETKPSKSRNVILLAALSLAAGAGLGATGMFLAGGSSEQKTDPAAIAKLDDATRKLTAAEQAALEAKNQLDQVAQENSKLKEEVQDAAGKLASAKLLETKAQTLEEQNKTLQATAKALEDEKKKLATDFSTASTKLSSTETELKKLDTEKTKLIAEVKKAGDEANRQMALAADARKLAEEKEKEVKQLELAASTAASKLKSADSTLDAVLEKLKVAKLLDDKLEREKAIAALPDIIKKANLVSGDTNVTALAKQLSEARDEARKLKLDSDKALSLVKDELALAKKNSDKQLADAKTASQKALADLQAKLDTADKRIMDEVKKAIATATKDADDKLAKAREQLDLQRKEAEQLLMKEKLARTADLKQYETTLSQRLEQFQKDLAAARAGVELPLSNFATAKKEESLTKYDSGIQAYFDGRYADAEAAFAEAVKVQPSDARYWYFLGLCKYAQGKTSEAVSDFKSGADWEGRAKPGRRIVATALEPIQGAARLELEKYRP